MIDHPHPCQGLPCTCHPKNGDYVTAAGLEHLDKCHWDIPADGCNCIHIDGVWMTRHSEQCSKHPCTACLMRAGHHTAHISIEGLSKMPEEVHMRNCWACGAQQYLNRQNEWTHVYPAAGCLHDEDTRERVKK